VRQLSNNLQRSEQHLSCFVLIMIPALWAGPEGVREGCFILAAMDGTLTKHEETVVVFWIEGCSFCCYFYSYTYNCGVGPQLNLAATKKLEPSLTSPKLWQKAAYVRIELHPSRWWWSSFVSQFYYSSTLPDQNLLLRVTSTHLSFTFSTSSFKP
jgi:hypothetical protein